MASPFVDALEGARTLPVGFSQIEPGVASEIIESVVRTDRQPWRFDFRTGTLDSADWTSSVGTGMTATTSAGTLVIATGTTVSQTTSVRSTRALKPPARVQAAITLSQRIANQEFYFELVNAVGDVFARWKFDGTVNTTGKVEVGTGSLAANQTLNSAITTSATSAARVFEIEVALDEVYFRDRGVDTATASSTRAVRNKNIPHPDDSLYLQFRAVNLGTAPATSTNYQIDWGLFQDENQVAAEIVGGRGVNDTGTGVPVTGVSGAFGLSSGVNRAAFLANHGVWQDTSSTPQAIGGTVTGTTRDLFATASATGFNNAATFAQEYRALAVADVGGDLFLEVSRDSTTWRRVKQVTMSTTGTGGLFVAEFEYKPKTRYARVVFVNGGTAQTHFTLQEVLMAA